MKVRLYLLLFVLFLPSLLYGYSGDLDGCYFPSGRMIVDLSLPFIDRCDDRKVGNDWSLLKERVRARFGFDLNRIQGVQFIEGGIDGNVALLLKSSSMGRDDIKRFFGRIAPGEMKEYSLGKTTLFFVPEIIYLFMRNGKFLITDGDMAKFFMKSSSSSLNDDKNYTGFVSLLKGLIPDFYLFAYPHTIVADYFERFFNIPEFSNWYRGISSQ